MPASPPPGPTPFAGGFPIAMGAIAGTVIGVSRGQATLGFLMGIAAGIVIAVAIWLMGRRR